eukprot:m.746296 g.746296  ORF g.746296 m.746296 type:complete len:315 (-) comp23135_c0_seq3:216-1160(-)
MPPRRSQRIKNATNAVDSSTDGLTTKVSQKILLEQHSTEERNRARKRVSTSTSGSVKQSSNKIRRSATCAGPSRDVEVRLTNEGYKCVVGVDEAGRGPLAGPVVAAACHIPLHLDDDPKYKSVVERIADSKALSESERDELFEFLTATPGVLWATHAVDAPQIDAVNILQATMLAMHCAVQGLAQHKPDAVLVDGNRLPWGHPEGKRANGSIRPADPPAPPGITHCESIVKGDATVLSIAAASIIAKVTRDRLMHQYDTEMPQYLFRQHKGYPTREHISAIHRHGVSPIHRLTFAPLKTMPAAIARLQERTALA